MTFRRKWCGKPAENALYAGVTYLQNIFRRWQINGDNDILFMRMIPERLGGHDTIENVFVTHRWCSEKYRSANDYDTLPANPERYLSYTGEHCRRTSGTEQRKQNQR